MLALYKKVRGYKRTGKIFVRTLSCGYSSCKLLFFTTMADSQETAFVEHFKEHLKKNVYDITWSAFARKDQSSLSEDERKVICDKFVKAMLILWSITINTPNKCVDFFQVMDELRVHIEAID